ncbi:MAG: hypothetical protein K2Q45_10950 [Nitrosomonas sp.]|nr:hypothetical protein [Nitrosomonas sp.]
MADIADSAGDLTERSEERNLAAIRKAASDIPLGEPGECIECGLESKRLVNDRCAPSRDRTY